MIFLHRLPCLLRKPHVATRFTNGLVGFHVNSPIKCASSSSSSSSNSSIDRRTDSVERRTGQPIHPVDASDTFPLVLYQTPTGHGNFADGGKSASYKIVHRKGNPNHQSPRQNNGNSGRNSSSSNNKHEGKSGKNVNNAHRVLNEALTRADSTTAILQILRQQATLQHVAAGQSLSSINFSTALHRLARFSTFESPSTDPNETKQAHAQIVSDPHMALLITSVAESMLVEPQTFDDRGLASIAWALAKLQLPPPLSVLPWSENAHTMKGHSVASPIASQLQHTAETVRQIVMDAARERAQQQQDGSESLSATLAAADRWIPALSQLSGYLLDYIGELVLEQAAIATAIPGHATQPGVLFQMQSCSNLLWAWSTAGRANDAIFGLVIRNMIQQQSEQLSRDASDGIAVNDTKSTLTPQVWSNAVWSVATARCNNGHDELLSFVARLIENHPNFIMDFQSQNLANTAWGVATILSTKNQKQPATKENVTLSLSVVEQQSTLTILRYCLQEMVRQNAVGFNTQDLSNIAWAAATLGFGLSTATTSTTTSIGSKQSLNNHVVLDSLQPAADATLMVRAINTIISASMQQLPRFSSQGLSNLAWAVARLLSDDGNSNGAASDTKTTRANFEPWLRGIGLQLADPRRAIIPRDVTTTLWALATLKYCDESIYRGLAKRIVLNDAQLYEPQDFSNSLWAFAAAEVQVEDVDIFDTSLVTGLKHRTWPNDPVAMCFAIAAQELMRRPQQFNEQDVAIILWTFSKAGIRHPTLFKSAAGHLVGDEDGTKHRRLDEFSGQGLGNMAWAYARQGQLANNASERLNRSSRTGTLLVYQTFNLDIGEKLLQQFFGAIAEASLIDQNELRKANFQHISNTAWAFASLGLKETRYLEAARDAFLARIDRYLAGEKNIMTFINGQHISNLLWALATLNASPGKSLQSLVPYLQDCCGDSNGNVTALNISKQFTRQGLANMAWVCAVFGNCPDDLMSFLYTGLLGSPGENDPAYMQAIYNDSGLQLQHVTTLVYAQAEMQLSGRCLHLLLPDNFPEAWLPPSSDRSSLEDHVELKVRTSKMQRDVSAAFSRIHFGHVEEYTLTMADMVQTYGIRMPSCPMEMMSIDIANVDEKIAIEIEGPPHYVCRIDDNSDGRLASEKIGCMKMINGQLEYQFRWTGEQQEMNGSTALKERLLTLMGWKVVHIPF